MSLSSLQLDAFLAVAQTLSFSQAAKSLFVTQSALSQRIKNLEEDVQVTLFVRHHNGLSLSEEGTRLLRYCQLRAALETELLETLGKPKGLQLGGVMRIAAYSTVLRSAVLPALAPLLRKHADIQCRFVTGETWEILEQFKQGQFDFLLLDSAIEKPGMISHCLGEEKYCLFASASHQTRMNTFLDTHENDLLTERFLRLQKQKIPAYKRAYVSDIYAIADSVAEGLGRAVLPLHLFQKDKRLKKEQEFQEMSVSVFLHFWEQPYYTQLHEEVRNELLHGVPRGLSIDID
jgi:DNA-binding transcriptional LysR family regulator